MIIVFEGIDGAGKTTMCKMLKSYLEQRGFSVAVYSYPNKSSLYGKIIRQFLSSEIVLDPEEQFFLYILDMYRDKKDVLGKISQGYIVLMDRYYTSTIAYQCSQGFDYNFAKHVIEYLRLPKPEVIIYLDIDPITSLKRLESKEKLEVFERNISFLEKVRNMYLQMAKEGYPTKNWIHINAKNSIDKVFTEVVDAVCKLIKC